jgi:hypothetical protein
LLLDFQGDKPFHIIGFWSGKIAQKFVKQIMQCSIVTLLH